MSTPLIAARAVSFGYDDRVVVARLDLSVGVGEVVALLGPNGSGKSTLVKGLFGLVPRLGGTIEVEGKVADASTDHARIGYVPQRHSLAQSVRSTVSEVVAAGRLPHRPWWQPATRGDRDLVARAIEAVGLRDRAHAEVSTLSGGQQRRVLIARALAGQPALLVMDEPTAGVDHASQVVLTEVLGRLAASGTAMLVVTHELDVLADVVTRIVCLDAGHIDFDGSPGAYAAHLADADHPHVHAGHHHDDDSTGGR